RFAADRPPSADLVQTKGLGSQISPAAGEMSAQTGTRRERSGIIFAVGDAGVRLRPGWCTSRCETVRSWSDVAKGRSEYLSMAQTGSQGLEWAEGWGVV